MADLEGNVVAKDYGLDHPQIVEGTHVKGSRPARLRDAAPTRAVLPVRRAHRDAGVRPRLLPGTDERSGAGRPQHRAARAVRRCADGDPRNHAHRHPCRADNALVLRASGGPSILKDLSDERIAMDMVDAVRIDAAAVAVQVFIGGEQETQSVHNMTQLVDAGLLRHPRRRGDRGGPRAGARRPIPRAGDADHRRARRPGRQDLLLRGGLRAGHRGVPRADHHGRRQEAAGGRRTDDGLPGGRPGRLGRRHGPEHLPAPGPEAMSRPFVPWSTTAPRPAEATEMYRDLSGGAQD